MTLHTMGSPKKWLRGDIHTMGVKMAKNWVAPLVDSPLRGLPCLITNGIDLKLSTTQEIVTILYNHNGGEYNPYMHEDKSVINCCNGVA